MKSHELNEKFMILRESVLAIAGADLPDAERQQIKLLVGLALQILESAFVDVKRIADACETLVKET